MCRLQGPSCKLAFVRVQKSEVGCAADLPAHRAAHNRSVAAAEWKNGQVSSIYSTSMYIDWNLT